MRTLCKSSCCRLRRCASAQAPSRGTCHKVHAVQVRSSAFATPHARAGVLSWCLAENDDDDAVQQRENYANTEFLITLGAPPGCALLRAVAPRHALLSVVAHMSLVAEHRCAAAPYVCGTAVIFVRSTCGTSGALPAPL